VITRVGGVSDDPVEAVDALVDRLVAALSGTGGSAPARETTASAAGGQITVVLGPDGRVRSVDLDPRLLRDPAQVAPGIRAAVNEALDGARAGGGGRTHGQLVDELRAVQAESVETTKRINASLVTTLERLKGA
jgi:YbaB/EbfC DNA-binding family protein